MQYSSAEEWIIPSGQNLDGSPWEMSGKKKICM